MLLHMRSTRMALFRFARASGVLHDSRLRGGFVGLVWSRWWKSRDMLEASAGESDSQGKLHLTAATWLFLMPSFWHMSPITSPNLHRDMSSL